MAGLGGIIIFAAAFFVTLSVVMSNLGFGGIRGEFELVELACATCASLFLPLCQLNRGHVMVDVFTGWIPPATSERIDGLWMLIFAIGWAFLFWRLCIGLDEIHTYGDKTMLLQAPVWWVYIPAVIGTGLSAVVAACMGMFIVLPKVFRAELN
ncbi:hypothetical protein GCM10008927_05620 [Amylibacter ulvae]|uniref:TRAP transporter small permease protein n=2 Tax=Paramylibacter ulvae TaxID=1651968 RepID=A0ABQ3CTZ1_9RHOB|nr:hypothetical protein GCM10008927_05620 [Amylibacter ulvae]